MTNIPVFPATVYACQYTRVSKRVGPAIGFRKPLVEKAKPLIRIDEQHGAVLA